MGTISEKLTYLNGTKQKLKQAINNIGGEVTDETTFRNYANQLQNVYDNLPKTEYQEGTEITLSNTLKGKLDYENGVVGIGQTEQDSTQGYNIVNTLNFSTTTINGVTCTNNGDGTFTINGTATADTNFNLINGNNVVNWSAGTYKLLGQPSGDSGWDKFILYFNNWDGINCYSGQTKTLSSATTSLSLIIRIGNGKTYNNLTFFPMITTNTSLTNDDCEQYTGGQASPNPSYPQTINSVTGNQDVVVSGINKLQQKLPTTTLNGITCTNNSDGSYTFSGTASANVNFRIDQSTTDGTDNLNTYKAPYTMVASIVTGTPIGSMFLGGYSDSESWSTPLCNIGTVRTITSNINNAFCYIRFETGNVVNETIYPMILDGEYTSSNIPNFEPYITPTSYQLSLGDIELCKIGNYQDYIYKSGGKWYAHKEIGNNRLTSTNQEWNVIDTSISNKKRYSTSSFSNLIKRPSSTSVVGDILCSHYISQEATTTGSFGGHQGISASPDGQVFVNDDNYLNDFAGWKTWLDSVFCEFYYALATPTDTEITDTTLISQLNAWYNAHSNNGTTIITSNGNLPMIIKVRGLKGE